ncbi:MAG: hypothetical protein RIT43_1048, partial [Bacteroidota bacterium]
MSIIDRAKELNKKWIVSVVFITIVAGGIIFLLFQNINENTRKSIELKERIDELTRSTEELTLANKKLKKSKDSLQQHVTYMWPMRSIVYNAKLRDKVMSGIEFVPGQKVRVKTDSSIVIITDYLVG